MPKYIIRLILLFALFLISFLVLRHFLVPESFGDLGHYRANAIDDIASLPVKYTGNSACIDCHEEIDTLKRTDKHAFINCESCHGPGYLHIEDPTPENIVRNTEREFCGRCHTKNASRAKIIKQVDLAEHNTESKCVECHNPHAPWN